MEVLSESPSDPTFLKIVNPTVHRCTFMITKTENSDAAWLVLISKMEKSIRFGPTNIIVPECTDSLIVRVYLQ